MVKGSTLDLAASCEFLVVLLNGGLAAGTWDEPCTECTPFVVGYGLYRELEILNDFCWEV